MLGKDQEIQGIRISVGSAVPKLPPSARQSNTNNQRIPVTSMQAALQSTMMGTQQWGGKHSLFFRFRLSPYKFL